MPVGRRGGEETSKFERKLLRDNVLGIVGPFSGRWGNISYMITLTRPVHQLPPVLP